LAARLVRDEEVAGSNPAIPTNPLTELPIAAVERHPVASIGPDQRRVDFDVIVVAFGAEPLLERCIRSVLDSQDASVRILLIDNGCTNPDAERIYSDPSVKRILSPSNLGFAGGVMAADPHLLADHVALVNSDVLLRPDVLSRLKRSLDDPEVGIVSPLILRLDDGLVNSAGNPLHLLGYSWAGRDGAHPQTISPGPLAVASGAMLALRRDVWQKLGGLPERFFLYQEDVDLSLACHQAGYRIMIDPTVSVLHDHDWGRNPQKLELAERNRLAVVLTRYPTSLLLRLMPLLVATELGVVLLGGLPGARRAKLRGYLWLARNRSWLRERRRRNRALAAAPSAFLARTSTRFDESAPQAGLGPWILDRVVPKYAQLLRIDTQQEVGSLHRGRGDTG